MFSPSSTKNELAIVMTDNGSIYWGEPVSGLEGCITLKHVSVKENKIFPTHKGNLSIPLFRVKEIITVDDTFTPIHEKFQELLTKYEDFRPNDKDDPSIGDDWTISVSR